MRSVETTKRELEYAQNDILKLLRTQNELYKKLPLLFEQNNAFIQSLIEDNQKWIHGMERSERKNNALRITLGQKARAEKQRERYFRLKYIKQKRAAAVLKDK